MRNELNKMKRSIGYSNESDIDDRIATLEFKLWTESISLKEEKKYLAEIQELKRNRSKVSEVNKMESSVATFDNGMSMKEKASVISEEMNRFREEKKEVQTLLSELMEGRKAQLGDFSEVVAQRDAISKQIAEKIKERNQLRDDFKAAETEYWNYQKELRRLRQEKYAEERNKKNAEWEEKRREQAAAKLDDQPHVAEMTLLEQTISFCKSLTQSKGGEVKEEKKATDFNNPEGHRS